MDTARSFDRFHQTMLGLAVVAAAELGLAYAVISLAFDSGFLWEYAIVILLLAGTLHNLVRLLGRAVAHVKTN